MLCRCFCCYSCCCCCSCLDRRLLLCAVLRFSSSRARYIFYYTTKLHSTTLRHGGQTNAESEILRNRNDAETALLTVANANHEDTSLKPSSVHYYYLCARIFPRFSLAAAAAAPGAPACRSWWWWSTYNISCARVYLS